MYFENKKTSSYMQTLLSVCSILIVTGLLFIYSSSSIFALELFGSSTYFIKKQLIGLILGIISFIIINIFSLNVIYKLTPFAFLTTLILTACTLIPKIGVSIYGSSRWLNLKIITFQPSELLKITLILYVARFLSDREKKPFTFAHSYIPLIIVIGLTSILLLSQPDFGLAITLATTAFLMLFIAGFPLRYLFSTFLATIPLIIFLILKYPYRLKRIFTFLDPWKDPQGAGFQIIQSLIAIGSGHWLGSGISQSKQKFFYLPMQHTDFIFAIIAEETGFIGCSFIIFLFFLILYYGMKIGWHMKKTFHALTIKGFTTLLLLQTIINIFVTIGLFPTKGIGLPFVSYGNSSLITLCIMLGIMYNMAKKDSISIK